MYNSLGYCHVVAIMCILLVMATSEGAKLHTLAKGNEATVQWPGADVLPLQKWKNMNYTVAIVTAHPDDAEALAGGTMMSLVASGIRTKLLVLTNGNKGCQADFCKPMSDQQLANERRKEQYDASAFIGMSEGDVRLLDYNDGFLTSYPEQDVRRNITQFLRDVKADVVIGFNPLPDFSLFPSNGWGDLGYHADHQTSGHRTLDAQFLQGNVRTFPDTSSPAYPKKEFYMFDLSDSASHVHCISKSQLQAKIELYKFHRSQYKDPDWVRSFLTFVGKGQPKLMNACGGAEEGEDGEEIAVAAEGFLAYY